MLTRPSKVNVPGHWVKLAKLDLRRLLGSVVNVSALSVQEDYANRETFLTRLLKCQLKVPGATNFDSNAAANFCRHGFVGQGIQSSCCVLVFPRVSAGR